MNFVVDDKRIDEQLAGMTITPAQCRAARGLLDLRQGELADAAGVGLSTVRDLETRRREISPDMLKAIRTALEAAGVELLNGARIGVRLKAGVLEPDPRERRSRHGNARRSRRRPRLSTSIGVGG